MSIEIACPSCKKAYRLKDELAGKSARCSCGERIKIPARVPEPANDFTSLLDEIEEPTTSNFAGGKAFSTHTPANPLNVGTKKSKYMRGYGMLGPLGLWLESTGSAVVKLLIGGIVGAVVGLRVLRDDKGGPGGLTLTGKVFTVAGASLLGAGAASLLVIYDLVRSRKEQGKRIPLILRLYFGGWVSIVLWVITAFVGALLWAFLYDAMLKSGR